MGGNNSTLREVDKAVGDLRHAHNHLQELLQEAEQRIVKQRRRLTEERNDLHRLLRLQQEEKPSALDQIVQRMIDQQSCAVDQMLEQHSRVLEESDERSRQMMHNIFTVMAGLLEASKEKDERVEGLATTFKAVKNAPTRLEIRTALLELGYEEKCLNLAITGCTGVGKSALLDALFGWMNRPLVGRDVGTTMKILKIKKRTWGIDVAGFDIPGSETINLSRYDYFKNQGLYIMNAIIIVWSDRLTDTDTQLIMHCIAFKVPYFLVRTKCDIDLQNFIEEEELRRTYDGEDLRTSEMRQKFERKKGEFRQKVQDMACIHIIEAYSKMKLKPPSNMTSVVYLVNQTSLWRWSFTGRTDLFTLDDEGLLKGIATTVANHGKEIDKSSYENAAEGNQPPLQSYKSEAAMC